MEINRCVSITNTGKPPCHKFQRDVNHIQLQFTEKIALCHNVGWHKISSWNIVSSCLFFQPTDLRKNQKQIWFKHNRINNNITHIQHFYSLFFFSYFQIKLLLINKFKFIFFMFYFQKKLFDSTTIATWKEIKIFKF